MQNVRADKNPYLRFIYTSFQERATFISHGNTATLAKKHRDLKLFKIEPNDAMLALADMMKKKITMPGHLMYDGQDENLFVHYSATAQRIGVYTAKDYANILEFLIEQWQVDKLSGLMGEGCEAQDYVCNLAPRIRRLEERAQEQGKRATPVPFSWIF